MDPPEPFSEEAIETLRGTMIALQIQHLGINHQKLGYKVDQEDIPTVVKYSPHGKVDRPTLNLDENIMADFYLNFAWCQRRQTLRPHRLSHPYPTPSDLINERLLDYGDARASPTSSPSPSK